MEEDDVTIREQNFHSQVREYIVSNVQRHWLEYNTSSSHFNSHMTSFTYISETEKMNGLAIIEVYHNFPVETVVCMSEVH